MQSSEFQDFIMGGLQVAWHHSATVKDPRRSTPHSDPFRLTQPEKNPRNQLHGVEPSQLHCLATIKDHLVKHTQVWFDRHETFQCPLHRPQNLGMLQAVQCGERHQSCKGSSPLVQLQLCSFLFTCHLRSGFEEDFLLADDVKLVGLSACLNGDIMVANAGLALFRLLLKKQVSKTFHLAIVQNNFTRRYIVEEQLVTIHLGHLLALTGLVLKAANPKASKKYWWSNQPWRASTRTMTLPDRSFFKPDRAASQGLVSGSSLAATTGAFWVKGQKLRSFPCLQHQQLQLVLAHQTLQWQLSPCLGILAHDHSVMTLSGIGMVGPGLMLHMLSCGAAMITQSPATPNCQPIFFHHLLLRLMLKPFQAHRVRSGPNKLDRKAKGFGPLQPCKEHISDT